MTAEELREIWRLLSLEERVSGLELLPRPDADDLFQGLTSTEQAAIMVALPRAQQRSYMRLLAPDDLADLLQRMPEDQRAELLALMDDGTRAEAVALLKYEEDAAGGLMNPRYMRLRPDMTAEEAIFYIRRQADARLETIYVCYVLDSAQHLLGVVSLRELLSAKGDARISALMTTKVNSVHEDDAQETVYRLFKEHDLNVVPVLDSAGVMKGIVTLDDIVDVVQEEATEDIQRLGGMDTIDRPYPQVGVWHMLQKRAGWLAALFIGEMFTATAMIHYEDAIKKFWVLSLFVPLLTSTGGNSGSQSTALIVRALALGELKARDFWLVLRKELSTGIGLGLLLGGMGWLRVAGWGFAFDAYGPQYLTMATIIGLTVVCVVLWGTISGAMLPFLIARCGFDPATSSAPFVATFVDVTAIVIYFQIGRLLLP